MQDVDGEMGKVVGAKGWESQANALGGAGGMFVGMGLGQIVIGPLSDAVGRRCAACSCSAASSSAGANASVASSG